LSNTFLFSTNAIENSNKLRHNTKSLSVSKTNQDTFNKTYTFIKKSLNTEKPGFGKSDYGNFDVVDIPKAYAMFLSAELMQYKSSKDDYNLSMAINAGNWLLNHADLNNNGIIGWGVPVAWDAYGDKSINEKNTEYTIATGIVLNSLMDWLEIAPRSAPKEKILKKIKNAIKPYLKNNIFSNTGLYNYSLKHVDRKHNNFNPAAYMAGQMQRFSNFISDRKLKNNIKLSTDKVMTALIKYRKIDPHGGWYWSYSAEQDTIPNDLAHACYTIDGIMTYIKNNGTLKDLFNIKLILQHAEYFSNYNGENWYFFPSFYEKDRRKPRLYGLGIMLNIYSKYIKNRGKINALLQYTQKYKVANGLYSRWQNEKVVVTEYLTYLMYGIASSSFYGKGLDRVIYLHNDKEHIKKVNSIFNRANLNKKTEIPFTSMGGKDIKVFFNTATYNTEIAIRKNNIQLDKYEAVPVKLLTTTNKIIVILKELLTNHLILVQINTNTNTVYYKKIDNHKDIFSDFREAIIFNKNLIIVTYQSQKGQNKLSSYSVENKFQETLELPLPSVEHTAGGTYEVIPKMILLQSLGQLYILSGRLFGIFDGKKFKQIKVDDNVKVFLEAIETNKNEIYTIYRSKSNDYHIFNLTKNINYYTAPQGKIIFGLDYYWGKVQFRKLNSKNDIKDLFINDFINNKGAGTLYLGSNNLEGWLAWAQVYYLNGMMSFLELAKNDIEFFAIMKEYIPDIKKRLDLEIMLFIHQRKSKDGLQCRVFSIDRSLATFAVQSSRFGILLNRYLKLFPNNSHKKEYQKLKEEILTLDKHMEVLEQGTSNIVSKKWNPDDGYYLKWRKGNKFYFDGLNVPYNHQNEWATFILKTTKEKHYIKIANSIVHIFLTNITNAAGELPQDTTWPHWANENDFVWFYWWGKAFDGWNKQDNISKNKGKYVGDKIVSWISFRTIDAISVLSLYGKTNTIDKKYISMIRKLITKGYLYPYASSSMVKLNSIPLLDPITTSTYLRFSSPWGFDNSVWSYLNFIKNNSDELTKINLKKYTQ